MKKVVMVTSCTGYWPKSHFNERVRGFMGRCESAYRIEFSDGTKGLLFANEPARVEQILVVRKVGTSFGAPDLRRDFYKVVKERAR